MRNFFQHIRRQPKAVRDNYALGIAGSFTSVVLLLWVVAFPDGGLLDAPEQEVEKLTPFSTLLSQSKEKLAEIKASLNSASSTDSLAAVVTTSTTTPENIILSDTDIALALDKASSTQSSTSTPTQIEYTEVLIGTTTESGTGSFTGTATQQTAPSATVE